MPAMLPEKTSPLRVSGLGSPSFRLKFQGPGLRAQNKVQGLGHGVQGFVLTLCFLRLSSRLSKKKL